MPRIPLTFLLSLLLVSEHLEAQVIVNEVMFDPSGSEFTDEFVELLNVGDEAVDLAGWRVGDERERDPLVGTGGGTILEPGTFAVVLDPGYFDSSGRYDPLPYNTLLLTVEDATIGSGGLSNSRPERVFLVNADGDTVSAVTYAIGNIPGRSEERIDPTGGDDSGNWADARWDGGTPGAVNSVSPKEYDVSLAAVDTSVSTVSGEAVELFVEVRNLGSFDVEGYSIRLTIGDRVEPVATGSSLSLDAAHRVGFLIEDLEPGIHEATLVLGYEPDQDPTNDTTSVSLRVGTVRGSVVITELMAIPGDGSPEWVELLNVDDRKLDLSGWRVRDRRGTEGELASSLILQPGGYALVAEDADVVSAQYPDVTSAISQLDRWPTLNNSGDVIVLLDVTGATIDSIEYAAALPYRSLERIEVGAGPVDPSNWLSSTDDDGATPGRVNSVALEEGVSVALEVDPLPVRDRSTITYTLPSARSHVNLSVFDSNGHRVRWLLRGSEGGSRREVIWDGLGERRRRLSPGIYILLLEAESPGGRRFVQKRPIVLARGLR